MAEYRIGISGWRYAGWRGCFYPKGLAQASELAYAAGRFDSIEINGSFYSLQWPESWRAWKKATPEGFVFAVKGPRFITHMKKLKDVEAPLANFFATGVLGLGKKLGPILWQFPEQFPYHPERFAAFLGLLPKDTAAAARLARRHDHRVAGRTWIPRRGPRPLRHAFEVRHESYRCPEFTALLRRHGAALVIADTARRWPYLDALTADFAYVRLHGAEELYASGYDDRALSRWARRARRWHDRGKRDVYVYFDNDAKVHAPFDAQALRAKLGLVDYTVRSCAR